jgi:hypothetical protein
VVVQGVTQPSWSSTLYGSGLQEYVNDELTESFDLDLRDADDGLHTLAGGFMILGNWAVRGDMQFRGTIHHLEVHNAALSDVEVGEVLTRLATSDEPTTWSDATPMNRAFDAEHLPADDVPAAFVCEKRVP